MNDVATILLSNKYDLRRPSQAERVWLWRRRQQSALTWRRKKYMRMGTREAAELLGVRERVLVAVENGNALDAEVGMVYRAVRARNGGVDAMPGLAEACALARKRSGMTVDEALEALGSTTSKQAFGHHEAKGSAHLVEFWRNRGFIFPNSN